MNKLWHLLFGVLALSNVSWAYEVDTHAWLTKRAFDRSTLSPTSQNSTSLYKSLGWERLPPGEPFNVPGGGSTPDRNAYYDLIGTWSTGDIFNYQRAVNYFEQRRMPLEYRTADAILGNRPWLRFESWLMRGAIREDDLNQVEYTDGISPDRDPHGEFTRVLRHFYNPINDGTILNYPGAPEWSLGVVNAFATPQVILTSRDNHFTWADARLSYFRALTFKRNNPQAANPLFGAEDSISRHLFWGTTLKSIGHVLHLLQDSAQPQHTRIDYHNHSNAWFASQFNTEPRRRTYEIFTNLRILGATTGSDLPYVPSDDEEKFVTLLGQPLNRGVGDPMPIGSYPVPAFTQAVEYFTTKGTDGVQTARRGLADYSNRGFLTEGTLFNSAQTPLPPSGIASPGNDVIVNVVPTNVGNVRVREVRRAVPDAVAPGYVDPVIIASAGKAPLYSVSMWDQFGQSFEDGPGRIITLQQYKVHADMLAPRAIAYGAGLIDYFFRGRLEITVPSQSVLAVLNQGEPHTIDASGYPHKTNGDIFGFEKVRLRVRNITDAITEPGPSATAVPQVSGNGELFAVARYHRNSCYKSDLSGERISAYAPPPSTGVVTEPNCTGPSTPRTKYQEISVSAPLTIANSGDLPGGEGVGGPATPVDKVFDFSANPIPINATDLFIQVVYRGTLGEETESIAIGSMDVREPTIVTFWENTDYYFDVGTPPWKPFNASFPLRPIQYFRFCIGASAAERLGYWFAPPLAGNAMSNGGSTRIAVIVPPPTTPTDRFRVKGTPVTSSGPSGIMQPLVRTAFGRVVQANREFASDVSLAAPFGDCATTVPVATEFWCNEPLQRRRGLLLGSVLQPVAWVSLSASGFNTSDVADIMPAVAASAVQPLGEVRFNDSGALANCPPTPTAIEKSDADISYRELEEVARSLGIKL